MRDPRHAHSNMAVCVAVIAKENYPLYIRSVPSQSELKFHYTVHTSLDVVEEKISTVGKAMAEQRELYLGLLYPTEDYKVYPLHEVLIVLNNHGPFMGCV
uniref:Trafficking protein particle complex 2-like n=1 Tax=Astyanax mexicanus TaxID=7994 RepID=A0A8B9GN10_ASTMX